MSLSGASNIKGSHQFMIDVDDFKRSEELVGINY